MQTWADGQRSSEKLRAANLNCAHSSCTLFTNTTDYICFTAIVVDKFWK